MLTPRLSRRSSPPLLAPHHLAVCSLLAFMQRKGTAARRRLIPDGVYNLKGYLHVRGLQTDGVRSQTGSTVRRCTSTDGVCRRTEYLPRRVLQYIGVPPRTGSADRRSEEGYTWTELCNPPGYLHCVGVSSWMGSVNRR